LQHETAGNGSQLSPAETTICFLFNCLAIRPLNIAGNITERGRDVHHQTSPEELLAGTNTLQNLGEQ